MPGLVIDNRQCVRFQPSCSLAKIKPDQLRQEIVQLQRAGWNEQEILSRLEQRFDLSDYECKAVLINLLKVHERPQ